MESSIVVLLQVLTGFWQFGRTVCKLGPFTTQLSVAASSLTLCCIAFDRYVAVVHPLQLSTVQVLHRTLLLRVTVVHLLQLSTIQVLPRKLRLCVAVIHPVQLSTIRVLHICRCAPPGTDIYHAGTS